MRFDRIVGAGACLGLLALAAGAIPAFAARNTPSAAKAPTIVGAQASASKTIAENAANAKDLATLTAAIKAASLLDTLSGAGPYTVFAPTDSAFRKLPPGTVDNLLKPENKAQLQTVLTYHVVAATLTAKDLLDQVKSGGGKATLKTVQGEPLTVEAKGRSIDIVDAKGDTAHVTIPGLTSSNGIIHVVDTVLLP